MVHNHVVGRVIEEPWQLSMFTKVTTITESTAGSAQQNAICVLNMHGKITYDAIFSVHGTGFAHGVCMFS